MKLKYVNPKKLKILIGVFFMVGVWGIAFGLWMGTMKASMNYFMIVVLGVVNLFRRIYGISVHDPAKKDRSKKRFKVQTKEIEHKPPLCS